MSLLADAGMRSGTEGGWVHSGVQGANIQRSVIGCNAYIEDGVFIDRCMILSNTFYTNEAGVAAARAAGEPVIGIGAGLPTVTLHSPCSGCTLSLQLADDVQTR